MWFPAIAQVIVLAAVVGQMPTRAAVAASSLPEPVVTRQNCFAIPFRVEPADQPSREPAEVLLYVSADQGKTWQLHYKSDPAEGQFLFRSQCDGEFWFILRTVDRSGQTRPAGVQGPGLRVIVDTVPPVVSLEAKVGLGGQVTARWLVEEANPKVDTFSIQYRSSANEPWQTVAIDHHEFASSGAKQVGEATWVPSAASGPIEIRAEVADAAGNSAVSHAQIDLSQGAAFQPAGNLPVAGKPPVAEPWKGGDATGIAPIGAASADTRSADYRPLGPASPVAVNPPIGDNYEPRGAIAAAPAVPRDWPYWVNKRVFDLNYDVQSVGPSGLGRVEVWGTRDGGRDWKCFAVDDDNLSPVSVKVDEEGVYGFRVVMQSKAGVGGQPPKSGEAPDLWVGVDCTSPTVKIVAAQQDSRAEAGTLTISWKASDQNLAAQPITLYYSERASGPWTPIASGLPNTGTYAWTLPKQIPPLVYLRIEARDQAGNIGRDESSEPVHLNPIRASAQSRGVLPFGLPLMPSQEASRTEARRSYFK